MSQALEEAEKELALRKNQEETIGRLRAGGITAERAALETKRLSELNADLATLLEKSRPPPPAPVLPKVGELSPAEAKAKADAIRKNPQYWDPRKPDAEGKRLTAEAHDHLVREHQELLARADEET